MFRTPLIACLLAAGSALGCDDTPRNLTPPTEVCVRGGPPAACRPPDQLEALLRDKGLWIESSEPTSGRQHARVLTLIAPSQSQPIRFRAKWRAMSTAHELNDPRKEAAAHALQRLFLEPDEWILPPSHGHCFELAHYRAALNRKEQETYPGSGCVFGTLSYWLEHGHGVSDARRRGLLRGQSILDREAFERVPSFRRTLADTNLLAYLASNGDTHPGQFVLTGSRKRPIVHLVDFTIAFTDYRNPALGPKDSWSIVHVPALRDRSLQRLRALDFEELERLLVFEEYEARSGRLVPVAPSAPLRRDMGLRWSGEKLQLGLMESEIRLIWTRLQELLARVDRGEIPTFGG